MSKLTKGETPPDLFSFGRRLNRDRSYPLPATVILRTVGKSELKLDGDICILPASSGGFIFTGIGHLALGTAPELVEKASCYFQ